MNRILQGILLVLLLALCVVPAAFAIVAFVFGVVALSAGYGLLWLGVLVLKD